MSDPEHRVSSGDTLYAIARRHGTTVEMLSRLNGLDESGRLWPGQVLKLPKQRLTQKNLPLKPLTYRVPAGATLSEIARLHHVTPDELAHANGLKQPATVGIGQVLNIPNTSTTARKVTVDPGNTSPQDNLKPPKNVQEARKRHAELAHKKDSEIKKIIEELNTLASASSSIADKLAAAAKLAAAFPKNLVGALKQSGVKDKTVLKIAGNKDLIKALVGVFDAKAKVPDRIGSGLTLAAEVAGLVPEEKLAGLLTKLFDGLPAAATLAGTVGTMLDPNTGVLDKAQATLDFVIAAKDAVSKIFPQIENHLRATKTSLALIGSGITLLDDKASWKDKASAVVTLLANAGDVLEDLTKLRRWLTERGIKQADQIVEEVRKLPRTKVQAAEGAKELDPKLTRELPAGDAQKLEKLVAQPELEKPLLKLMGGVQGSTAAHTLIDVLGKLEPSAQKGVVNALSGLEHGVLNKLLAGTTDSGKPLVQAFAELTAKLPETAQKALGTLVADFDEQALKSLLKFGEAADSKILGGFIEFVSGNVDSKVASGLSKALVTALAQAEKTLAKVGLKLGKALAGKVFKGLAKMVPVAGAIPAALAVWDNTQIAMDLSLPPEIRYLATLSAQLNAVDAVLGVLEVLVVTNIDLPVQLALGAAELLLDLVIMAQTDKFKANPKGYKPPDWLDALIAATAVASAPNGLVILVATFGVQGAERKLIKAAAMGGKLAIAVGEHLGTASAEHVGRELKMTGDLLHRLADLVRNPEKYLAILKDKAGKALALFKDTAQKALALMVDIIQKGRELAIEAWELMKQVVDDLRQRWEEGIALLQWIAQHPGKIAELAVETLHKMVQEGLRLATAATKKMVQLALITLGKLQDFYVDAKAQISKGFEKAVAATQEAYVDAKAQIKKGFEKAVTAIKEAFHQAVDYALQKGQQCLDAVRWVINHPGTAARMVKDKLVKVISGAGQLAKQAFLLLVELGKAGLEHVKQAIDFLKTKAEEGLKLIVWVAQNPGQVVKQVVQAAVGAIKDLANGVTQLAKNAMDKLVQFIDGQVQVAGEARAAIADLIKQGGAAIDRVLEAWKTNLTEGGKAVLSGLKDLGQAGAEALQRIVAKGGQLAQEAMRNLESMLRKGAQEAFHALEQLARQGGEAARRAIETLKNSAPAQFAVRVFDTLMAVGNRKDVKAFLDGTEHAFQVVAKAYDSGGLAAVANLVGRVGLDIGTQLISTLWEKRHRLKKGIDSVTDFAMAFSRYFSAAELEKILGVDIPLVGN